jgi:hypothetical protein
MRRERSAHAEKRYMLGWYGLILFAPDWKPCRVLVNTVMNLLVS